MTETYNQNSNTFRSIDRATWKKYLFYTDMVVWTVFAAGTALLIRNVFIMGVATGRDELWTTNAYMWDAGIALSFMLVAMTWIFFRFWKNGYLALKRPF